MFFCAYICKVNAIPPDSAPAYNMELSSSNMFDKITSSNINAKKIDNEKTNAACKSA